MDIDTRGVRPCAGLVGETSKRSMGETGDICTIIFNALDNKIT